MTLKPLTNKDLNILFTASWYPSKAHPTLGNFIQRHAEAVARMHHVHVLYIASMPGHSGVPSVEQSNAAGVETTIIYCSKGWINKFRAFRLGVKLLFEKQKLHFDFMHHHVLWPHGWQARWINHKYRIPYIVTEHWTGYDPERHQQAHPLLKPLSKYAAAKAFAICPVTQNLSSVMTSFGISAPYRVVPNVVDTSLFNLTQATDDCVRFLHVSSLVDEQKNITGILRVWKSISDVYPLAHLAIGGDGPYQLWERESQNLGIPLNSIEWFGEIAWHEVATKMQSSHALILFSNYENLPCVILEAMACGLAIISTRVGGISEHISNDRGILIEPDSEKELYSAIAQICGNTRRFNRSDLRAYAINHFSQEAVAKQFNTIYLEALAKHR